MGSATRTIDPTSDSTEGALFFNALITRYVNHPDFAARPWLETTLETALAGDPCVTMLLGAPGAGKTVVMASLARRHPGWLRYFIRRDSREPLSSGDGRSFLFTIGHQFAALHPDLFQSSGVEIDVNQEIDTLQTGGTRHGRKDPRARRVTVCSDGDQGAPTRCARRWRSSGHRARADGFRPTSARAGEPRTPCAP